MGFHRGGWLATVSDDVVQASRLLRGLRTYLRHPVSPAEARGIVEARLQSRANDFVGLVARAIYAVPDSPYRALLGWAGCELADLERLVQQEGVEGALRALLRAGVYLSVEEFKGRQPVVRGGRSISMGPGVLRNPLVAPVLTVRSSGSGGPATPVPIHLGVLGDRAVSTCAALAARGGSDWRKAVWADPGGVPGLALRFSGFGRPAERCFAVVAPDAPGLLPRYRWSMRVLRGGSRLLAGVRLPKVEHVPPDAPLPIARWMAAVLRAGAIPHLWAFVSPALHLCKAAKEAGLDIRGVQLTVTGEPLTAARRRVMRDAGVVAVPDYGTAESGFIGHGCLAPAEPDDMHVMDDLHALIQVGRDQARADAPDGALLVSSLRESAPVLLLNVSLGDTATLGARPCGCALEGLGWTTHLSNVRSYEKLTSAGMTFLDADVVRVLEEVLPARFGGGPNDYQLVEEEASGGQPQLRLLVHPTVGPVDPGELVTDFLAALGADRGAQRVMAMVWRDSRIIRVERRPPFATRTGKVLHLHRHRGEARGEDPPGDRLPE